MLMRRFELFDVISISAGVRYEERGPAVCEQSKRVRTVRMIPDTPEAWLPSRTSSASGISSAIFDLFTTGIYHLTQGDVCRD
jgi:hypothetical protein